MDQYNVLISKDFLTIQRPSARSRRQIITFVESLSADPHQLGDYEESDTTGRPIQIKVVSKFALSYWVDHGEKEVRITKIEPAGT